ncbi:MAG: hypothetical protein HY236_07960 [Acidobacteria bacterium]|nr:hypothetical protein [Acidobacteriota bacterium]
MLKSLRLQLTAWYLLFFTLLLVGFSAFLYTLLRRNLQDRLDASLAGATRTAARLFESELGENHGDAQAGAAEALVELRFPNTWLAIFEGEQLLAASHPQFRKLGGLAGLLADAGARGQSSLATVQGFGANGARVLVLPFQTGGRRCFLAAAEPLGW